MKTYIALLRGINISGKNKVNMTILKQGFYELEYENVRTYINTGNVIFRSEDNLEEIVLKVKDMILTKFFIDIPIVVFTLNELKMALKHAPDWWGTNNKKIYDNLVIMVPPYTVNTMIEAVGIPQKNNEKIKVYGRFIYWSTNLKGYTKTSFYKIARSVVNNKVTIRNANTIKKIILRGEENEQ